ncbi:sigma-70 family RNA polymerase sigma factor [Jonesiaceae bacterium BS-20]|uniref:Sigma-70 family RNA polymerase sigma factor n=1 Tax=Jonesiaceae bacterium BS-20 TaxID=3120821 RepID=A0AAU7DW71_9MICO
MSDVLREQTSLQQQWKQDIAQEVAEHMAWLMGAARNIASQSIEAEDLLSDAITKLFALAEPKPPQISNVRSYLTTIMRNAAIDWSRSPRSRVEAQETEYFVELAHDDEFEQAQLRSADLHKEFAVVRQAFAELQEEDRDLLEQVLIQGRKASDAGKDRGLTAAAASVRVFRAKVALKRQVLVQFLCRGDRECAENATKITGEVQEELAEQGDKGRGMRHVHSCELCKKNWKRFAYLSRALGITSALTVTLHAPNFLAAPASAAPASAAGTPDSDSNGSAPQASSNALGAGAGPSGSAGAATGGGQLAGGLAAAQGAARLTKFLQSKASLVIGVAALVLAGIAVILHNVLGGGSGLTQTQQQRVLSPSEQVNAVMEAQVSAAGGVADLEVTFNISDASWWTLEHLTLVLPQGAQVLSVPQDLECAWAGQVGTCVTETPNWSVSHFTFEVPADWADGSQSAETQQFAVDIKVATERNIEVVGQMKRSL